MKEKLKEQLIRHEGIRLKVYNDSVGIPTIGVGRNLRDRGLSHSEVMLLLENDIHLICLQTSLKFPWFGDLNEARKVVVCNMVFNLGLFGFSKFKNTIRAIENDNFYLAGFEMLASNWATQVGKRARELALIMQSGEL